MDKEVVANIVDKRIIDKSILSEVYKNDIIEISIRRANGQFKVHLKAKILDDGSIVPITPKDRLIAQNALNMDIPRAEDVRKIMSKVDLSKNKINKEIKNLSVKVDDVFSYLKNISYMNTVLSLANIAVDIIGFKIISDKLNDMTVRLNNIDSNVERLLNIQKNELIEEYQNYIMDANDYFDKIQHGDSFDNDVLGKTVGNLKSFVSKLNNNLAENNFSGDLIIEMIFALVPAYTALLDEYLMTYYDAHKRLPSNYSIYISLYDELLRSGSDNNLFDHICLENKQCISDTWDIINAQKLFLINGKTQIEDSVKMIAAFGGRSKLKEFENQLFEIEKQDIFKKIPLIAAASNVTEEECRVFWEKMFA